jgi:hypothetical protein
MPKNGVCDKRAGDGTTKDRYHSAKGFDERQSSSENGHFFDGGTRELRCVRDAEHSCATTYDDARCATICTTAASRVRNVVAFSLRRSAVAMWAAHQACAMARVKERPCIASALVALDHAEPLPQPFHDKEAAFAKLLEDQGDVRTVATLSPVAEQSASARVSSMQISKQHAALPAIFAAVEADPLHAACDARLERRAGRRHALSQVLFDDFKIESLATQATVGSC